VMKLGEGAIDLAQRVVHGGVQFGLLDEYGHEPRSKPHLVLVRAQQQQLLRLKSVTTLSHQRQCLRQALMSVSKRRRRTR
jgi:hypothetical protein